MEISDIQIDENIVEITFCRDDAEDVMTIKISMTDAKLIKTAIERHLS